MALTVTSGARLGARHLREHDDPGLTDGMGGKPGPGLEAGKVGQVHHLATRGPERGRRALGAEEDRAQVQVEDRRPTAPGWSRRSGAGA